MEISIEKVYSEFMDASEANPDFIVDFFKRVGIFKIDIKSFNNENELRLYIELTWQYIRALYKKDYYNEAIDFIEARLLIIENEINRLASPKLKDKWFLDLFFYYGASYYRLKNYLEATKIFKDLVNRDNKNDSYKEWLRISNNYRYKIYLWIILIVSAIIFTSSIILIRFFHFGRNILYLEDLALIGMIVSFLFEYFIDRPFRKRKKKG